MLKELLFEIEPLPSLHEALRSEKATMLQRALFEKKQQVSFLAGDRNEFEQSDYLMAVQETFAGYAMKELGNLCSMVKGESLLDWFARFWIVKRVQLTTHTLAELSCHLNEVDLEALSEATKRIVESATEYEAGTENGSDVEFKHL